MPDGNPLTAFARLAGVPCRSANPVPEMAAFDCGEGRRLSPAETSELLDLYLEGFPEAAGGLLAGLGPDASMAEAIETFVAAADQAPGQAPGWARRGGEVADGGSGGEGGA